MSYSITGTTITLTRGDTFEALVSATKKDGTPYIPVKGDVIRFAMKENYDDARPLLVKEIPIDTMMLMLEPSDTADLNFGKYVYDIQLIFSRVTLSRLSRRTIRPLPRFMIMGTSL